MAIPSHLSLSIVALILVPYILKTKIDCIPPTIYISLHRPAQTFVSTLDHSVHIYPKLFSLSFFLGGEGRA